MATTVAAIDGDDVVPEYEDSIVIETLQEGVSAGAGQTAITQTLENIRALVAYSQAAQHKAAQMQNSHESMSHSVITNVIAKMAAVKPAVLAVSYAKYMGDLRKYFDVGLSKYELDHIDRAILHSTGVIEIRKVGYSNKKSATFSASKMGLSYNPTMYDKLAVPLHQYQANFLVVNKLSASADNQVAAECIRQGLTEHYKTFLQQVKDKYKQAQKKRDADVQKAALKAEVEAYKKTQKLQSEAPAAQKAASSFDLTSLASTLLESAQHESDEGTSETTMQAEAAEMAKKWSRDHKSVCSDIIRSIEKIEGVQVKAPNCEEMAGEYVQGIITMKKGHLRGKMNEVHLQDHDLKGSVETVNKKFCAGSATGHLIHTGPGVATAKFKFDKKLKTIQWSSGIVWKQASTELTCTQSKSGGNKWGASTVKAPGGIYTITGGGYHQKNGGYNKAAGVEQFSFSGDTFSCDAGFGYGNADCYGIYCKKGAKKMQCQQKSCRVNREAKSCTAKLDKGYVMTGGGLINHYRTWDRHSQFEQSRPEGYNGWLSDMGFGWGDFTSTVRGCKGLTCVTKVSKQGDATTAKCPSGYSLTGCGIQNDNHSFNKLSLFEYVIPNVAKNKCDCNMGAGTGKDKCYARCCKTALTA
jgi:hypothetical protein